jgi:ubiquinone/menaquinone biosynthesis C-methylase UbiE
MVFELMGLKEGEVILDAGCGNGYMSMIASRIVGKAGRVFAFDIHEKSLDILQKRIEFGGFFNIDARVQDLTEPLPIDDKSLDHILFTNVIHGFMINGETKPILNFIRKKLKIHGKITIIEFKKEETELGPPMNHRVLPMDISTLLLDLDLSQVVLREISDNHYIYILQSNNPG